MIPLSPFLPLSDLVRLVAAIKRLIYTAMLVRWGEPAKSVTFLLGSTFVGDARFARSLCRKGAKGRVIGYFLIAAYWPQPKSSREAAK
jgi:hypothetical protein